MRHLVEEEEAQSAIMEENMNIQEVPFSAIDWNLVSSVIHPGITGEAYRRVYEIGIFG